MTWQLPKDMGRQLRSGNLNPVTLPQKEIRRQSEDEVGDVQGGRSGDNRGDCEAGAAAGSPHLGNVRQRVVLFSVTQAARTMPTVC